MEIDHSRKISKGDLKEVVYTTDYGDKNEPTLLKSTPSDSTFLYISAFTADIIVFASGCSFAWSSPVFSKLKEADPSINPLGEPIVPIQESWIAALVCLGAAVGPLIAGKLADCLGRKKTLILVALPMVLAYMMLAFATSLNIYYIARFVLGLGVGSAFAILPMYLGEITEIHNRGKFGCIMTVFVTLGLLYPLAVGPFLSVKVFSFSCAVPLMLFIIFFSLFIPESPVYLASKGNTKEAKEVLIKLRNKSTRQIEKEFVEIVKALEEETGNKTGVGAILRNASLRTGLIVCIGLVVLQQFAGINAVLAFLGPIFEAAGTGMSPYASTVIVGIIQVFSTILTASIVEKLGRKFLLVLSTVGSCVSILLLGLYFYLKTSAIYNVDNIFWLPVLSLIVYIVIFNMGLGPLPWTIMGEVFPANVKSVAAALTTCSCFAASFGVTLGFPIIVENVGMAQCFWLFGSCCLIGTVFIYCIVPETKGKTLTEIQQILGGQ